MLRVRAQAGVVDGRNAWMWLEKARQRQCIVAGAFHAQRQRLGSDRKMMGLLRGQGSAPVAQALFTDLGDGPLLALRTLVVVVDIAVARPVEQPGVGDGATQCVAMTADVLGQGV